MKEDALLVVVEDEGTESWLDNSLQDIGRLEKVSRDDLGRVLRLLEATGATIAMVEVTHTDFNQSMAVITALNNAQPWVTVVAVCQTADQEVLLNCMRAGARDCVVVGGDATELRDRLRRHQLVRPNSWGREGDAKQRNLTMVVGVTPYVDTAFFTQNLAMATAKANPEQRTLAIDIGQRGETVFHLDTQNTFDLEQLLSSPDTLDENLIETALPEFRSGLRLLNGGPTGDFLGDRGADLFIALTRLMGMFDSIIVNVGNRRRDAWVKAIGMHVEKLLVVAQQEVTQLRHIGDYVASWRAHLPQDSAIKMVLDGYEASVPPSIEDIEETVGSDVALALPMDWKYRLEAMNVGLPMDEVASKGGYNKKMQAYLKGKDGDAGKKKGFLKRKAS